MRKPLFAIICIVFLGVLSVGYFIGTHLFWQHDRVVEIVAVDPSTGQLSGRGMGYLIDTDTIITSAHVVADDRYLYRIARSGTLVENITVQTRLSERDIAILSVGNTTISKKIETILTDPDVSVGDTLSIPLVRSGSLIWADAHITSIDTQILAYDQRGQTRIFSGIILPNMPFLPGDSGAPIFTKWGKLIDVVHVE